MEQTPRSIIHINLSINNVIVTLTTLSSQVVTWASGGRRGAKGRNRSNWTSVILATRRVGAIGVKKGLNPIILRFSGVGKGLGLNPDAAREGATSGLRRANAHIVAVFDVTPLAHNGCRSPKQRRV
nr:30S ribosomal protein S11 [Cavernulicola chilensis]